MPVATEYDMIKNLQDIVLGLQRKMETMNGIMDGIMKDLKIKSDLLQVLTENQSVIVKRLLKLEKSQVINNVDKSDMPYANDTQQNLDDTV